MEGDHFPKSGDEVPLTEQQFKEKLQDMSLSKIANLSREYSLRADKYHLLSRWAKDVWLGKPRSPQLPVEEGVWGNPGSPT